MPGQMVDVVRRNNVRVSGRGQRPVVFAHGFGCDQNMWRHVVPAFEADGRVVLFDHVGCGQSDKMAYDVGKYGSLAGYASDVLDVCRALRLERPIFVGHSVSAMIGVLAAAQAPELFEALVLVGPSPRYINDGSYVGGFERADIEALLEAMESNYLGWSSAMAPAIMGNADRPELGAELTASFCQMDPAIARQFAQVTFLSDNREDLRRVCTPSLILQCARDVIAPEPVGRYVHGHLRGSEIVFMKATGHCPNLSAPEETVACIRAYLGART